ncbi:hypothetical protein GOP47_0001027 [Adiantum capillus-veneris]|uniref:Uncharacterized protein n=1 Tax=Adiantum capillus-veneris TaxID=13818 RepID=A0A9D4VG33_ADICA|nr:hypothetical protein GOP47_0001027 [Adiantum capillus-veneris]
MWRNTSYPCAGGFIYSPHVLLIFLEDDDAFFQQWVLVVFIASYSKYGRVLGRSKKEGEASKEGAEGDRRRCGVRASGVGDGEQLWRHSEEGFKSSGGDEDERQCAIAGKASRACG